MTKPLWTPHPDKAAATQMSKFRNFINNRHSLKLENYDSLYEWSVTHIAHFWEALSEYTQIIYGTPHETVLKNPTMPGAIWFEGARLNFAENLLRFRDDRKALTFIQDGGLNRESITYKELFSKVAQTAAFLKNKGLVVGDRVAAFLPNRIETVIAMLATTSLGGTWSSCSPDFGFNGVIDRFSQIEPKILLTSDGYFYGGKNIDSLQTAKKIKNSASSIETIIIIPYLNGSPSTTQLEDAFLWNEVIDNQAEEIAFTKLPFDHPLYVMYSSGTTGVPKCMVHGAGGTLLQHAKELLLHCDVQRDDTIFYYTTCGWMMWNWLVSSLFAGAHIVLYDGNPFWPDPNVLWKMSEDLKITIFGTSAKYISVCTKKSLHPGKDHDLSSLRTLLSTGSPLSIDSFTWIYEEVKADLHLASISGGTDLISCFILGDPTSPVYAGEIQKRGLGMKVESWSDAGLPVFEEKGELVCTAPFPSMPIYFWNDPENAKYLSAYFKVFPGIWQHGDYIEITKHNGIVVHGRSDATLNPGGIRLGTADIYRIVEGMAEITDSIAVAQTWEDDVRILLFVVTHNKQQLTSSLIFKIKQKIRSELSPHHIPAIILSVPEIPTTINGKKVELAVTQLVHGEQVKNKDSLANPDALGAFENLQKLQE